MVDVPVVLPEPYQSLVGQTVLGKWRVESAIPIKESGSTGGNFCVAFRVKHLETGQLAFLKLLDVIKAMQEYRKEGIGVAETLQRIGSAHLFETQLMEVCKERRLHRIVRALAYGDINMNLEPLGLIPFPCLIFELAEGDTHKYFQAFKAIDLAWWFRTLHQATIGVQQLHGIGIVHQDIKPSNVVFFGVNDAKLADLGRAVRKGTASRNDGRAGDGKYIPPEYLYPNNITDWNQRFLAMDLYLLGSLAFLGITGLTMTGAIMGMMPPEFLPQNFGGEYSEVLPVLIRAQADVLEEARVLVPEKMRVLFIDSVRQLCHPDPAKRGHPRNEDVILGGKYSLAQYVSIFHRLVLMAESELK